MSPTAFAASMSACPDSDSHNDDDDDDENDVAADVVLGTGLRVVNS